VPTCITFSPLRRRDYARAIRLAMDGMNYSVYMKNPLILWLYGRHYMYSELSRSTQNIAAYAGDRLVGYLLADMKGEPRPRPTLWQRFYCGAFTFFHRHFFGEGVNVYDEANEEMFARYCQTCDPDGQLVLLVADPASGLKGVGTMLLQELEKREAGKTIYLYTDDNCTWQFYERRGFDRAGEKEIVMDLLGRQVPLTCLLYSKRLGK